MAKINLNNVTNPSNVSVMNDNFQKVAKALNEKVLYRGNVPGEPNQMESPLDMNGERLYNLPVPVQDNEAARLQDIKDTLAGGPYEKGLRVLDENIPAIPDKAFRANKMLTFDHQGKPTVAFPASDSATQLRIDLANPAYGAGLLAFQYGALGTVSRTVAQELSDVVVPIKRFNPVGDGVADDTLVVQRAINATPDHGTLNLQGMTLRVKKAPTSALYPLNDQPCIIVANRVGLKIINGNLIVKEHGQGAVELLNCIGCDTSRLSCQGPGNFPPLDGASGRGEKGFLTNGYYNTALYNSPGYRNNQLDTSAINTGGYGGNFPRPGGGTGSNWGVWNGGFIFNFGDGITVVNSERCRILDGEFSGFNGSGINQRGSSDLLIEGNKVHLNYSGGIVVSASFGGGNITVRRNTVLNNGHPDSKITDEVIDPGYGFAVGGGVIPPNSIEVTGNYFKGNKRKGVDAHSYHILDINNNVIEDSGYGVHAIPSTSGSPVSVLKVTSNTIRRITYGTLSPAVGIGGSGVSSATGMAIISNNTLENIGVPTDLLPKRAYGSTGRGLDLVLFNHLVVEGNTLRNSGYICDYFIGATPTAGSGPVEHTVISSNSISGLGVFGMIASGGGATSRGSITGNLIKLGDIEPYFGAIRQQFGINSTGAVLANNDITLATTNREVSTASMGFSIVATINLATMAVVSYRQTGCNYTSLTMPLSDLAIGLTVTMDPRLPTLRAASVTTGQVIRRASDSSIVSATTPYNLAATALQVGLFVQDFVAKTATGVAGSACVGLVQVRLDF